jgi:hypothetical protein
MPIFGHCWSMVFGTFSRLCLDAFKRTGTNGRTLNVVNTQTEIQCSIAVLREVGNASAFPARPLVPGGHLPRTALFSINNPKHHAVAFSFRFSSRVPLIHLCDTSTLILDRSFISSSLPRTLTMSPPSLQTPLSKLLSIQYPIILAGMASLSCTNCM